MVRWHGTWHTGTARHFAVARHGVAWHGGTSSFDAISGGKMGKFSGKSELEWIAYRAAQTPAPGHTQQPGGFSTLANNGGTISKSR
jgi:hypothetical protein